MQKRLLGFLQQVGLFIKLFKVIDSTERCKIRLRSLRIKITHSYNVFIRFRVKFNGFSQLFGMILNLLLGLKIQNIFSFEGSILYKIPQSPLRKNIDLKEK